MFVRIRNRLTLLYTGLLILFLLAFMIITYTIFSYAILHDREEAVIHLAEEVYSKRESLPLYEDIKEDKYDKRKDDDDDDLKYRMDVAQLDLRGSSFYYLTSRDGKLTYASDDYDKDLRKKIVKRLKDWTPKAGEIRYENIDVDHNTIHLVLSGKSIYSDGKLKGIIYTGMDVSEQRDALDRLFIILIVLAIVFLLLSSIIGHFMAGRAMRPIMNAFARQRQFVADASHELRTPLSVMHASIEVIEAEERDKFSPMTVQIIEDMKDETQRMTHLVGDMLTLARADSGRQQLTLERFDLYLTIEKIVRSFQPIAHKRDIQLYMTGLHNLKVKADQERITQLLYILIDNAIKFTLDHGKIKVTLNEVTKGSARKASIAVSDTGIGMTDEQLQHIFDRFYRADQVRSRKQGGAGLGLAIAKWIVETHGGTLIAHSEVNIGSTFTAILPIIDRD